MKLTRLIKRIVEEEIGEIHTSLPARIESFDQIRMIASVTLLAKEKLGGEEVIIPPIVEVPVAHFKAGPFIIRPPYQKGDRVEVIFNEKALDHLLITGKAESVMHTRRFSRDDAMIIKGLKIEKDPDYPAEELDSLYISNLDKNVKLVMKPDGTFRVANDDPGVLTEFVLGPKVDNESNPQGYVKLKKTIGGNTIEIGILSDGSILLSDEAAGIEIKFNKSSDDTNGNVLWRLANLMKIGLDPNSATHGVVIENKLNTLITELQNHTHPAIGSPPNQTFSKDLGSERMFLDG